MSKFYKSVVNIAGVPRTVVQIQHESESKTIQVIDRMHHIHLADRSGSMRSHIDNLMEQIKLTLKVIPENDLFSLGWFSSKGQFKFVVKGISPNSPGIDKLIDDLKSTLSCTCFREILEDTNEVIKDTLALCPNFNITLFTDGQPMSDLSASEEIRQSIGAVAKMANKVIAFNTIGYGSDYNQDMLKNMAALTQYGVATHSIKITEYLEIFKHNYEVINELVSESVNIATDTNENIVYLNRKTAKLSTTGTFEIKSLDKSKNIFFIIGKDDKDFGFAYNGALCHSGGMADPIRKANINNLLYALIATKYDKGERREAIEIAHKSLKDKHLIDIMKNAFTMDEIELATRELNKNVVIPATRSTEVAPDDYLPSKDAKTVVDVLGVLSATECLYVPNFKSYAAVGVRTKDEYNLFTTDKDQKYSSFGDFVFSKEKLNMNLRFTVSGTVKLNPLQAKEVGLAATVPAVKFRNHAIIKDGVLNIPVITALVPVKHYDFILSYVGSAALSLLHKEGSEYAEIAIDLTKFPLINLAYAEMAKSAASIFDLIKSEMELEAKMKVYKHFIKSDKTYTPGTIYTPMQETILQQHGIKNGVYNSIAPAKDKSDENIDYYEAKILEMYIKGVSALPSMSDIIKAVDEGKVKKTANLAYPIMVKEYTNCKNVNTVDINNVLRMAKGVLNKIRTTIAAVKLAKIYSGDWFEGLEKGDKGEWLYTKNDVTMVVKADRERVPFSVSSEEE